MKTLKMNKIKDIEEFCKLFKLNIPVENEFDYYIETLRQSSEYNLSGRDLNDTINLFTSLEDFVDYNDYSSVRHYKNKCLDVLKDYILSTNTYKTIQTHDLPKKKMFSKDLMNQENELGYYMSIDFQSANYSILKTFDKENELGSSWIELCEKFNIHKALVKSKSFRQIVFGNINPKRIQTFQHEKIIQIVEFLQMKYREEEFAFISNDEIIMKVRDGGSIHYFTEMFVEVIENMTGMPVKLTYFSMDKINKGTFVKTMYALKHKLNQPVEYYLSESYKTLHGVQGNKFYMYFKKYILKQTLDERDLIFKIDGELVRWVDEDAKNKRVLPHYAKPDDILSVKDAKEYSFIWDGLEEVLPGLKVEEKRRIIELVANACKSCFKDGSGCQC